MKTPALILTVALMRCSPNGELLKMSRKPEMHLMLDETLELRGKAPRRKAKERTDREAMETRLKAQKDRRKARRNRQMGRMEMLTM